MLVENPTPTLTLIEGCAALGSTGFASKWLFQPDEKDQNARKICQSSLRCMRLCFLL